jgi:hypothetical protein
MKQAEEWAYWKKIYQKLTNIFGITLVIMQKSSMETKCLRIGTGSS